MLSAHVPHLEPDHHRPSRGAASATGHFQQEPRKNTTQGSARDRNSHSQEADEFLDDVVAGDQTELWRAYKRMWAAERGTHLQHLGKDQLFRAVLDRLANSFVLYGLHDGPVGERRVIKFSYDEPLTLRYAKASYQATHDTAGKRQDKDEKTGSSNLTGMGFLGGYLACSSRGCGA